MRENKIRRERHERHERRKSEKNEEKKKTRERERERSGMKKCLLLCIGWNTRRVSQLGVTLGDVWLAVSRLITVLVKLHPVPRKAFSPWAVDK